MSKWHGMVPECCGTRDPWTGKTLIAFANDLPQREGCTILSKVEVR